MSEAHVNIKLQRWRNVQSIFWSDGLDWMLKSSMEALVLFHRHVSVARPKQRRYEQTTQSAMGVNRWMDSTIDDMEGCSKRRSLYSNFEVGRTYIWMNFSLSLVCLDIHPHDICFFAWSMFSYLFHQTFAEFLSTLAVMTGRLCFY